VARSNYPEPPDFRENPEEFMEFMRDVFNHMYDLAAGGSTVLDSDNVDFTSALARANHTGTQLASTISDFNDSIDSLIQDGEALTWTYVTDTSLTGEVTKSAALANMGSLATTETADGTYSSNEQDMLNNIKTDLGTIRTLVNTLLANLRTAKLQET
jgi:hypothetical protein